MKKNKIFVLADDLTGASELGGIAFQFGLTVKILFSSENLDDHAENVIIFDSNTRNLKPAEASQRITKLTSGIDFSTYNLIYKKVDSVLRGSISSELAAFTKILNLDSTLLVPANPSKNRVIRSGNYYINDVPLHQTGFRFDPHFPRLSDNVKELVTDNSGNVLSACENGSSDINKIVIPDVSSIEEVKNIALNYPGKKILPGGGADLFRELLCEKLNLPEKIQVSRIDLSSGPPFIIGSNSLSSRKTVQALAKKGYAVFRLPLAAIDQPDKFYKWLAEIIKALGKEKQIAISGPVKRLEDPRKISSIGKRLVDASKIVAQNIPDKSLMLMEGGETASNFFRSMKWDTLSVCGVYGPGVVALKHHTGVTKVVIKPGSYPWPDA